MKIVIVGAGVAGLSIGWRLAQSGAQAVVLERAQPGRGATWAAGGMIAPLAEYGMTDSPDARLAWQSAAIWPRFAEEIEAASARAIGFHCGGSLTIAHAAKTLEAFSTRATEKASILSPAEARNRAPLLADDIAGALWAPEDAQVDNRALGPALATAFVRAGGTLQTNEAAVLFEIHKGRILGVRTPFAFYEGDAYVIAAGAWSGAFSSLPPEVIPPVLPVKGEMIALTAPAEVRISIPIVWGEGIYLVPRHGQIFAGATESREGFDTSLTAMAEARLFEAACSLMPALRRWEIAEHWAGLRPGSPDDLPILGETSMAGLFVASGQYRNGILLAPSIAEALCRLVMERGAPPEIAAFDPKRFHSRAVEEGSVVQ
ncbi:MAG TPA: glycine oxidase ThiO [Rhizomicrobium sp.]|nr:glycine oxidase ThiO [Rhizomicrobium sp.]